MTQSSIIASFNSELQVWPQKHAEWKIHSFWNLSREVTFYLDSPRFILSGTEWYISLCPNTEINSVQWISLYLCKGESHKEHYVDYNIGIKRFDGTVLEAQQAVVTFEIRTPERGYHEFIKRFELKRSNAVSPNGTLTIFCSFKLLEEPLVLLTQKVPHYTSRPPTTEPASQTLNSDGVQTLTGNIKNLNLVKREDVTITVDGRTFRAHRKVLAYRSKVFSSMFSRDMAENKNLQIEITDCDKDTFEEFLLFLYTGKFYMVTPSNAQSLYNTAGKYDVEELKAECVRCMINELTVDSFCDVVRIASLHDETKILQTAKTFFIDKAETILVTTNWLNFSVENPSLANEFILKFVNKYTEGK